MFVPGQDTTKAPAAIQLFILLIGLRPRRPANLPARDAELVQQLQLPPELRAGDLAPQQLAVTRNRLRRLVGRFVQELDSEMAHAQGQHAGNIIGAGLRQRVEDGVAAAGVRLDRVLRADAVAQLQVVPVARAGRSWCNRCRWREKRRTRNAPCETWGYAGGS